MLRGRHARKARFNRGSSDFAVRQTFKAALTWKDSPLNAGRLGKASLRGVALEAVMNALAR